jgi:hypothetical protein
MEARGCDVKPGVGNDAVRPHAIESSPQTG